MMRSGRYAPVPRTTARRINRSPLPLPMRKFRCIVGPGLDIRRLDFPCDALIDMMRDQFYRHADRSGRNSPHPAPTMAFNRDAVEAEEHRSVALAVVEFFLKSLSTPR